MIIREATLKDISGIARVHVDCWRSTYRGIVPDAFLANISYEKQEDFFGKAFREDDKFYYVADNESGAIVGFAAAGLERTNGSSYKGELYGIYILKGYQRRGIGRLLVQAVVKRLMQWNIRSMLVWVLAENNARGFYQSIGGREIDAKDIEIGDLVLKEIAYAWDDTGIILRGKDVPYSSPG